MKRLIQYLQNFITLLTLGNSALKKHLASVLNLGPKAVHIIEVLKSCVNSEACDYAVLLTATKFDDLGLNLLRAVLNILLPEPEQAKLSTDAEALALQIERLKALEPEHQDAIYHKAASLIIREVNKRNGNIEIRKNTADLSVSLTIALNKQA